ncbi:SH3 domain-containing protein [Methylobacterium sp. J-048]|uniref:SH3 domain-containing protein n=1 Tax=Methylobacterium sp. J-048 TaxID=2836635 RepID=UPI001FBAA226|nr:SH3 domain-containing protein [Methylobacterium sp. J-048]MCJ2056854.1 SH3 domain-containing protein [Methylobacterium sp. J-048]
MRYALAAVILAASVSAAKAETLRVMGVAPNDALNVREFPTGDAKIVGIIPPNGRGIRYSGDGLGEWIFVRYRSVEGWVAGRFVQPDPYTFPRGRQVGPED